MKKYLIIAFACVALISPALTHAQQTGQTHYYWGTGGSGLVNVNGQANVYPYGNNGYYGGSGSGYSASCSSNSLTLCTVINRVIGYLNQALFLLIGLAIVVFVWNVFKYFIKADADRTEAGKYVLYSVVGFFVILSVWGLVNILQNTFGLGNSGFAHSSWTDVSNIFPR
jgi:hypothetical protein